MSHKHLRTFLLIAFAARQLFANDTSKSFVYGRDYDEIEGNNVTMNCNSKNPKRDPVTWFKWIDDEWTSVKGINENVHQIAHSDKLFIENLKTSNAGKYMCICGTLFSGRQFINILYVRKRTKASIEHDESIVGKRVVIRCNVTADRSLEYKIKWKLNDTIINFEEETQLIKEADNEIIIQNAQFSDTGMYSCIVSTNFERMPNAVAKTMLIVKDVPNAPRITKTVCSPTKAECYYIQSDKSRARIEWEPNGDNGAVITNYIIEYNIEYEPDVWKPLNYVILADSPLNFEIETNEHRYTNYTFRVIAHNEVGPSLPSEPSDVCTSQADAPHSNPQNATGVGTEPGSMVISWEPMPPSEHNGPGFYYQIYWSRFQEDNWNSINVTDWMQNNITINGLQIFAKYKIRINSGNSFSESYSISTELIVYSGEDIPTQAPANFTLVNITDRENVVLRWDPVPPESVNGNISCYVIHIWNDFDGQENVWEIKIEDQSIETTITKLRSETVYHAQIFVENRLYSGPKSNILEFKTSSPSLSSQYVSNEPVQSASCCLSVVRVLLLLFIVLLS